MPQNSYTDADLARFGERPPLSVTIERPGQKNGRSKMDDELDAGQARVRASLEGAKRALTAADQLGYSVTPYGAPANPADFTPRHPVLRDVTQALQSASVVPLVGAGATAATGVGAPLSPALFGLSSALAAPDAIRRALVPEDDESRALGAVETAALAAPGVSRFFKGAAAVQPGEANAAQRVGQSINKFMTGHPNATSVRTGMKMAADDAARMEEAASRAGEMASARMQARQMESAGFSPNVVQKTTGLHPNAPRSISSVAASGSDMPAAVNPNQVISVARDVARSNNGGRFLSRRNIGDAVAAELPSYTRNPESLAALQKLGRSGFAGQAAREQAARDASAMSSLVSGAVEGPTIPGNTILQPDPEFLAEQAAKSKPIQGLLQALENTTPPVTQAPYRMTPDELLRASQEPAPLSRMDILRARAGERFGKRYYKE